MNNELPLSFDLLYQTYSLRGYRWAYRLLGYQQAAEDATQETFLRAWRYLWNFDPAKGALTGWLYRMTIQVICLQRGQRQGYNTTVSLEHLLCEVRDCEAADPQVRYEGDAGQLVAFLGTLPQNARLALLLQASGYREVEIARRVGKTSRTVRTWLVSGRTHLAVAMEEAR